MSETAPHPSSSFSAALRVHLDDHPGAFAGLAKAIGDAGGLLGAIDLVRVEHGKKIRDVTVLASDESHLARIVDAVRAVDGIEIEHVSDRTFLLHLGIPGADPSGLDSRGINRRSPGISRLDCVAITASLGNTRPVSTKMLRA